MRPNNFQTVSVLDEAIDSESIPFETIMEFSKTRDMRLIQEHYVPGQRPMVFNVRAVPHSLWESYVCAGGEHDEIRFRRAFICGVESVDNLKGDDGIALTSSWKGTRQIPGTPMLIMTEEECNEKFSPAEVLEIGSVIYKHSFLARRTKLTWQLPPSLFEPLASRTFRSAESNQPTASTQTSSMPSDGANHRTTATTTSIV